VAKIAINKLEAIFILPFLERKNKNTNKSTINVVNNRGMPLSAGFTIISFILIIFISKKLIIEKQRRLLRIISRRACSGLLFLLRHRLLKDVLK
jgi:hypothetical protein